MMPADTKQRLEHNAVVSPLARPRASAIALLALGAILSTAAAAQTFPARPIRIVMPFTPGGSTDLLARVIAQKMTEKWGTQNIVDNKPGAATIVATEFVAKSPADGYTLLFVTTAFAINP